MSGRRESLRKIYILSTIIIETLNLAGREGKIKTYGIIAWAREKKQWTKCNEKCGIPKREEV